MGGEVRRVEFATADAIRLEGVLHVPAGPMSCPAAVVCHPHPQMGGDMDSPVVVAVCRELAERGWAALRFNFRGKGGSEGTFDDGRGEIEDVAGALDHLCAQPEANPDRLAVVGYSFGAWVGLRHAVRDPRVSWLAGISLVQHHYDEPFLDAETRPKLLVVGDRDPWAPQDGLQAYVERLKPPKTLHILPGADHFFGGQEGEVARMVAAWLEGRLLQEWHRRDASLGKYQAAVDAALEEIVADRIVPRIWAHDHTVWQPGPAEIANRLGWLDIAEKMLEQRHRLTELVESVRTDGYTDVLLLGMGGSSLAPEVFSNVFAGQASGMLRLSVLDSTDPGAVLAYGERLDPARTLFIVATKSGGTEETLSFFKHFYNWIALSLSQEEVGKHLIAITDPGSKLQTLAEEYEFRATFLNDPNIGGRYSVLSYFGLVPAALVGVDVETLLERSLNMACNCEPCNCPIDGDNNGAWLGAVLGELAKAGRDKVTFVTSPQLANFGDWVEQLIAESTGKNGTGILPVVGEPLGAPDVYIDDRLFVYLRLDGDDNYDEAVQALQDAGQPVVRLRLRDLYDLGEQFFLWEMATAVAGYRLGINPFDQPNVEAAKVLARQAVAAYRETGQLPTDEPIPLTVKALVAFLAQAKPGDYVALQAYVQPTPETDAALLALRTWIRNTQKLATTVGYGPRFLHSTGQLHKGDRGNGLFIQFTSDPLHDVAIPDEAGKPDSSMTFGLLKMTQVLGDKQALLDGGRRVIRFHLGSDVVGSLNKLVEMLA